MKTRVLTLIIAFTLSNSTYSQCDFNEDYSNTNGWTQIGSEVEIINGQLNFINGAAGSFGSVNGTQRRVYKNIGTTLDSNDTWIAEFEFTPTSVGTNQGHFTAHILLALTAGVQEPFSNCPDLPCSGLPVGSQDGIMVTYVSPNPGNGELFFTIQTKDNTSEQVSLKIISNTLNTTYYLRLEKTSSTDLKLSIFSDPARTTHIANSPITETIPNTVEGLNTVQHGSMVRADYRRELTGTIDNLCLSFNSVGIFNSTIKEDRLILYPNPTSNQLTIGAKLGVNNTLKIIDISGKTIKTIVTDLNIINVADLSDGIYFIKLITKERTITKKFVKQ